MDKSRADFEAWAVSLGALLGIGPPDLSVDARGFYNDRDMVTGLACWQASRKQALEEAADAAECEATGDPRDGDDMNVADGIRYELLERQHMGDWQKKTGIYADVRFRTSDICVDADMGISTSAERHEEIVRLAKGAIMENMGMPCSQDWQEAALMVCRAVIEGDGLGRPAQ